MTHAAGPSSDRHDPFARQKNSGYDNHTLAQWDMQRLILDAIQLPDVRTNVRTLAVAAHYSMEMLRRVLNRIDAGTTTCRGVLDITILGVKLAWLERNNIGALDIWTDRARTVDESMKRDDLLLTNTDEQGLLARSLRDHQVNIRKQHYDGIWPPYHGVLIERIGKDIGTNRTLFRSFTHTSNDGNRQLTVGENPYTRFSSVDGEPEGETLAIDNFQRLFDHYANLTDEALRG